ncbi:MAG TPA: flavin reductase [Verrucomicrobiae bacterium]|nr:flavin reductase [Verrucomicrobiae bacterium]
MGEKRWRCTVCGYIHTGENPPEVCPVCGVDSTFFELVTEDTPQTGAGAPPAQGAGNKEIAHGIKPALFKISYGLYIITSVNGEKINGQCANTAFQITSEPPRIAIGINKNNYTHEFIQASGVVGVNILGQQGHDLVRNFGYRSGRDGDKFAGIAFRKGTTGVPILAGAIGYIEGKVIDSMDCGTHTLFLLDVVDGDLQVDGEPMTYEYFRKTK